MNKRIFAIIVVVLCAALLAGCKSQKPEDKTFKVGLECNYAPFNWTQTDNSNGAVAIDGGGGFCGGSPSKAEHCYASSARCCSCACVSFFFCFPF